MKKTPGVFFAVTAVVALGLGAAAQQAAFVAERRLDADLRTPVDNPLREAAIALGRRLFFDPQLSRNKSISCATCHDPALAFADDKPLSLGINGRRGRRNVPAIINRGYGDFFFWDGRAATLEEQVLKPIDNPDELGFSVAGVVSMLSKDASYTGDFGRAFNRRVNVADLSRALASYVRTIQSSDAPADRYLSGDRSALSPLEAAGLRVFRNRGLCFTCHVAVTFTDDKFHNTGIAWDGAQFSDEGRGAVTGQPRDRGAFKTPTLREIARTAPYMHDGSLGRLEDVIEFYDRGGRPNPNLDSEMLPLRLTGTEKTALAAFLRSLSGTITEGR